MNDMDRMETRKIRLLLWGEMTLEEMCRSERLLEAYGVRIDWDSMEDVADDYTVDAEWEHAPEFGWGRLMSIVQSESNGAIRLRWDDE